jgi:hypothetical protein
LPSHGGGDLLCLDPFRLAEQAVRGGEDRDAHGDDAGGDEEPDVDAGREDQPAGRIGGETAAA